MVTDVLPIELVPVAQACQVLGTTRTGFYTLIREGRIHVIKPHGRRSVVSLRELQMVAAEMAIAAGVTPGLYLAEPVGVTQ